MNAPLSWALGLPISAGEGMTTLNRLYSYGVVPFLYCSFLVKMRSRLLFLKAIT